MTAVPGFAYDDVPYPGKPFVQTHPDRLAVVARLFGLKTPDVAACRMLEVGCGDGANLLGMAAVLPGAEFVGIDLSETSIAGGKALARQTGLKNVTLISMDLCDFAEGEFDYIVAHGVYSWVPAPVRDRLLAICAQRLRPHGVAMVSYAAYPGGFLEQLIRAPMLHRAAQFTSAKDRVEAARSVGQMVVNDAPSVALRAIYQEEWEKVTANKDHILLHDQLSEHYAPIYFTEFIRHATAHGLRYLGEANLGEGPGVGADRIAYEQDLDFLKCRRFRQTILCHEAASILNAPDASALRGCYASAPPYLSANTMPALDAAWPGFVPCEELRAGEALLRLFAEGKIDLRTVPPPLDRGDSARPRATALARVQAASGKAVTNLLHHAVLIEDESTRAFLSALDGRRTRRELVDEIARGNASAPRATIEQETVRVLTMLGRHALLRK